MLLSSKKPNNKAEKRRTPLSVRAIGLCVLKAVGFTAWGLIALFGAAYILSGGAWLIEKLNLPLGTLSSAVSMAIQAALLYGLALAIALGIPYVVRRSRPSLKLLGLQRLLSWSDIGLAAAAFIPYLLLSALMALVAMKVIPGYDIEQVQETGFSTFTNQIGYVMAFITLVVLAPLAEEALFRGYLYTKLRGLIGVVAAALLVSLSFGFVHGQWNVAVDTFVLSLVLVALREITGSIWSGVVLHMIKNGIAYFFLFMYPML